jgi:hypothetical protein
VTHQVIEALQKEAIPVQQSCRVLEVSRSAFYEAKRRVGEPVICKESLYLKAHSWRVIKATAAADWLLLWQMKASM